MRLKNEFMKRPEIHYRYKVKHSDIASIEGIVKSTGFFNPEEVKIAVELIEDAVAKDNKSDYIFIFAEVNEIVVAYSCFGRIDGTESSYDLYWIVTNNNYRGQGIGKELIKETEKKIAEAGGHNIYVETASKEQYQPTRAFYEKCDYILEARLKQFYAYNDDKCIYVKRV